MRHLTSSAVTRITLPGCCEHTRSSLAVWMFFGKCAALTCPLRITQSPTTRTRRETNIRAAMSETAYLALARTSEACTFVFTIANEAKDSTLEVRSTGGEFVSKWCWEGI